MRFTLKDYQSDAVVDVLANLADARDFFHRRNRRSAFSLSATTGAGKTVMAAAVIEALFNGDEAFDFEADPTAVVLWFSDDPSLNEQTRHRLFQASDRIGHNRLRVVEYPFSEQSFTAGHVYFLNTSKLSRNSLLVRGHTDPEDQLGFPELTAESRPDLLPFTIWDTIRNTIEDDGLTLYLILDEAHRGLGSRTRAAAEERATIVSRLINGHAGIPPMPVVWGISATAERFNRAMASATGRTTLPAVEVNAARVQASGLLKDDLLLDIPAETGSSFDTVMLRRATRKIIDSTRAWQEYAIEQGQEPVVPLLVLQSPNTPSDTILTNAIGTVQDEWPELPSDAIAHVFGDHTTQTLGPYQVPYIQPQRVQDARHIRVLIAKDAISTGWDCPRAEVMMSFRPAKDETHITQLLGRMVRTPLARRIPGNDRLNSVACILPFFDRSTATLVARRLMNTDDVADGEGDSAGETGGGFGRRVLIDPQDMAPNSAIPDDVWTCFDSLPSQSLPKRGAKPINRLTALAQALANDALLPDAGKQAHRELHAVLDGLRARYREKINAAQQEVQTVEGETIRGRMGIREVSAAPFSEYADDRVIDEAFQKAAKNLNKDVAKTYADHLAGRDDADGEGLRRAYLAIAALGLVPEVKDDLDRSADDLAKRWLQDYRVDITGLNDARRAEYNELKSQSTDPQLVELTRPKIRTEETKDAEQNPLPTRPKHLLADEQGNYPIGSLNNWERPVLDRELQRAATVAWYRNPARASQDSLAVSYRDGSEAWKSLRPDFVFFMRTSSGAIRASIVDPHGTHLSDSMPKLRGLAEFATEFGDSFLRIDSIAEVHETFRILDLKDEQVRAAIHAGSDAAALFAGSLASDYR